MKKCVLLVLSLFTCLLVNVSQAQTGWSLQTNPLGFGDEAMLGKVQFVSLTEGWIACGKGGFLHTTDGGLNWMMVNPFPSDSVESFSDPSISMSWVGTTHGWNISTIGGLDEPSGAVIYKTSNGGANWEKIILSNETGTAGVQLQFVDQNTGWALTYNFSSGIGSFLKTTNGGVSWAPLSGGGLFHFVDVNNGWSFTGSGPGGSQPPFLIYKTTDGGQSWVQQFSDNSNGRYNAIRFSDLAHGWAVGESGKVLKTTNGGADWSFLNNSGINPQEPAKTVFSIGADHVWIPSKQNDAQHNPYLQYSSDGGSNWSTLTTPFGDPQGSNAVFSICFVDPQAGWITGDMGRIAKYSGITSIETEIANLFSFSLDQNYPNPFNPGTVINYNLPDAANTTLKVFDILGREVATLVNEFLPQGNYKVEFDGAGLPSGVYIYKLQSGNNLFSRKMILLK